MVVVAVAGGTGNLGRAIVEGLLASGKHEVKVLSRKAADPAFEAEIGACIVAVDYSSVGSLARTLEDHDVHTVISGIATHGADGEAPPRETELIRAADLSRVTRRMISSQWWIPTPEEHIGVIPSAIHKVNARKELEKTKDLEWTVIYTGYFMDYWGIPGVPSHLARTALVAWVDMANHAAAIPGEGDTPAVFTHTRDVGRFVAASLELEKWEHETVLVGDRVTWNEFLCLAEDATGTKFKVAHDSVDKLKTGQITELPGQGALYGFLPKAALQKILAVYGTWFEEGLFDLKPPAGNNKFLNDFFPEIKPMTVKEMLDKAWRKS